MDVVCSTCKNSGRIESVTGQRTTFLLKLPLTLAIIDGLGNRGGASGTLVPLFAVRETFRP